MREGFFLFWLFLWKVFFLGACTELSPFSWDRSTNEVREMSNYNTFVHKNICVFLQHHLVSHQMCLGKHRLGKISVFVPNSYFFSRIKTGWSFLTNRTNSDPNFSERYRTTPVEILQWAAQTTLTICVEWVGEHDSSLSIKAELIWDNWDVTGHLDTSAGAYCA